MPSTKPLLQDPIPSDTYSIAADENSSSKSRNIQTILQHVNKYCKSRIKLSILTTLILSFFIFSLPWKYNLGHHPLYPLSPTKLKCVYALGANVTKEGLGSILRRSQLASFIASSYNLPIQFPVVIHKSSHGYAISDMFSQCAGKIKRTDIPANCQLKFKRLNIVRCPRGDCQCKLERLKKHLLPLKQRCTTLGVWEDDGYNAEYTGCLSGLIRRYFGNDTKPKQDYDVIHYRAGDLFKNYKNSKTFTKHEMYSIISTLCDLSDRPIVILTEGSTDLPTCKKNGVILASNLSLMESFKIAQHATNLVVGESTFAFLLAELARPERMIILERSVPFYEWSKCEKWTILGKRGMPFHFDSKRAMTEAVLERHSLEPMGLAYSRRWHRFNYKLEVPRKVWQKNNLFERKMA